jgi:hypothetical protein
MIVASMKEIFCTQTSSAISRQVSNNSLKYVSAGTSQRALVDESGMILNQIK